MHSGRRSAARKFEESWNDGANQGDIEKYLYLYLYLPGANLFKLTLVQQPNIRDQGRSIFSKSNGQCCFGSCLRPLSKVFALITQNSDTCITGLMHAGLEQFQSNSEKLTLLSDRKMQSSQNKRSFPNLTLLP